MTKAEKEKMRVALARDVIRTIRGSRTIEIQDGAYIEGGLAYRIEEQIECKNGSKDARTVIKRFMRQGESCSVCAKGALLIAHVLRNDKMSLRKFHKLGRSMGACTVVKKNYPRGIGFTARQLDEIEGLFEGGVLGAARDHFTSEQLDIVRDWYGKRMSWTGYREPDIYDPGLRLIAIMKLVIKNKGKKILL